MDGFYIMDYIFEGSKLAPAPPPIIAAAYFINSGLLIICFIMGLFIISAMFPIFGIPAGIYVFGNWVLDSSWVEEDLWILDSS